MKSSIFMKSRPKKTGIKKEKRKFMNNTSEYKRKQRFIKHRLAYTASSSYIAPMGNVFNKILASDGYVTVYLS